MTASPKHWRINGFSHVKLLGQGTFAKVNLYIHELTGEEVAIKTIIKKRYDELKIEYPPRELSIMKCLQHPNLAQIYEIIEEEDKIHIVMEYINGRSLADVIPLTGFSEAYARAIFRDILMAVEYMHNEGIVHRDLKLDNILLTNNDGDHHINQSRVKLIDFGLSNSFNAGDLLSTFCGTPQYAAPELLKGEKYVAPPVDIWSLGVLLYAMCVGDFPFESPAETVAGKIPANAPISAALRHLLSLIFNPDSKKRISLHKLARHPWVNIGYPTFPVQPTYSYTLDPEIVSYLQKVNMLSNLASTTIRISNQSLRHYRYENFESFILEFNNFTTLYYLLKQKVERLLRNPHLANSPNSIDDPFSYPLLANSFLKLKKEKEKSKSENAKGKAKSHDSCVIC